MDEDGLYSDEVEGEEAEDDETQAAPPAQLPPAARERCAPSAAEQVQPPPPDAVPAVPDAAGPPSAQTGQQLVAQAVEDDGRPADGYGSASGASELALVGIWPNAPVHLWLHARNHAWALRVMHGERHTCMGLPGMHGGRRVSNSSNARGADQACMHPCASHASHVHLHALGGVKARAGSPLRRRRRRGCP